MKPEAMRIAILEDQGWRRYEQDGNVRLLNPSKETEEYWFKHGVSISILPLTEPLEDRSPNYPFDLNAILPLLPISVGIDREENGWYVALNGVVGAVNQSLAHAACEFYLKWKNLWKD